MNFSGAGVLVLGSVNLDQLVRVARLPLEGETLLAEGYATRPGGKGRNQAVAIARVGGRAVLVAATGDDAPGDTLRADLAGHGVDTAHVGTVDGAPTGLALITVDARGQNSIVVCPGANAAVGNVPTAPLEGGGQQVLLCSLEVPLTVVADATLRARAAGLQTVVNVSPMPRGDDVVLRAILDSTDVVVVNEAEARELVSAPAGGIDDLARSLLSWKPGETVVVMTVGAEGAVVIDGQGSQLLPAPVVTSTDTVGAGDTFAGMLALALAAGLGLPAAAALACAAGSIAVSRPGELTEAAVLELCAEF